MIDSVASEVIDDGDKTRNNLVLMQEATGIMLDDPRIKEWRNNVRECSDLSDEEMQMALLYNMITLEQSRWIKRVDLPSEAMAAAGDFAHSTSNAVAEMIVNGKIESSLNEIQSAREKLSEVMRRNGIQDTVNTAETKPEPNILSFENLVNQKIDRPFLDDPLLIIGLTTHGDIPAYVVSKLLYKKSIVSSVAFMRPTSRGGGGTVQILEADRNKMTEAVQRGSRILVVDDSIDKGESMEQSLGYLTQEYPQQEKTVCVAVALEVPYLEKIQGEKYHAIDYNGKTVIDEAAFFKPNAVVVNSALNE